MTAARQHSPAAERNKQPILEVLKQLLPATSAKGLALEIASGTGQHGAHFAAGLPDWTWQPSDPNAQALASVATCAALMRGAARHLAPQGVLVTYGPYLVDGVATAPSNLAFDADLRSRNPAWGLRRLADVVREAAAAGLRLDGQIAMPANNLTLVFRRSGGESIAA